MFRIAKTFFIPAIVGIVLLRVVFGGVVGMLFSLAWFLLKLICVAGAFYFALNMVSPEQARRVRAFFGFEDAPHVP